MENKLFRIIPNSAGYIQNDEVIVIATSEKEAKKIVKDKDVFDENQYPLTITEVNLKEKGIVLKSNVGA
ncbi:hypothetical protein FL857_10820 [Criibacterium bergeronii]|uniref:Uncharacterized protein n=1 Tax=Criibacterium bergeronii TaxID=1871336 RepID=A0A552UXD1_9FIRM|nr:hypothetical protein [Criibacterium bergeronii]TRW22894.1 hypothetical protein FL857_10820 [Criibacterium bergeronii]